MINKKTTSENRRILQIAVPSIISNITVPLLGLIDVTIVGHLGSPAYIGAIAVGGMLFNIIYWIFGFLRMGTSGMTSQAYGQHDLNEINRLLIRSVGVGLFIALCLLILQYPILNAAFTLIQTTEEVKQLATTYFYICIWGAPAMLGLYGFAGWFIGMQKWQESPPEPLSHSMQVSLWPYYCICVITARSENVLYGKISYRSRQCTVSSG